MADKRHSTDRTWYEDHLTRCAVCRDEEANRKPEINVEPVTLGQVADTLAEEPAWTDAEVDRIIAGIRDETGTWVCDRCGATTHDDALPFGWDRIYAYPNEHELCPNCIVAFLAWLDQPARDRRDLIARGIRAYDLEAASRTWIDRIFGRG